VVWAVNDAHVDTLGVLLVVAGLALAARGRRVGGGALLGAAIATKLIPALAVPGAMAGVLSRRPRLKDLVLPVTAVAVAALTYVPYVLASGSGVLGYLPGYLKEEGYDSVAAHAFRGRGRRRRASCCLWPRDLDHGQQHEGRGKAGAHEALQWFHGRHLLRLRAASHMPWADSRSRGTEVFATCAEACSRAGREGGGSFARV